MKTLYLIRHGETIEGKQRVILGQKGGTLSSKGKMEIKKIALKIGTDKFDPKNTVIISSNLRRARDSALILRKILDCKIIYDPLLQERVAGKIKGKKGKENYMKTKE